MTVVFVLETWEKAEELLRWNTPPPNVLLLISSTSMPSSYKYNNNNNNKISTHKNDDNNNKEKLRNKLYWQIRVELYQHHVMIRNHYLFHYLFRFIIFIIRNGSKCLTIWFETTINIINISIGFQWSHFHVIIVIRISSMIRCSVSIYFIFNSVTKLNNSRI